MWLFDPTLLKMLDFRDEGQGWDVRVMRSDNWRRANPEEVIRQLVVAYALYVLKYPATNIEVEHRINIGSAKCRADVVVTSPTGMPTVIIEVKASWQKDAIGQLHSYMDATDTTYGALVSPERSQAWIRTPDRRKHKFDISELPKGPAKGLDAGTLSVPTMGDESPSEMDMLKEQLSDARLQVQKLEADLHRARASAAKTKKVQKVEHEEVADGEALLARLGIAGLRKIPPNGILVVGELPPMKIKLSDLKSWNKFRDALVAYGVAWDFNLKAAEFTAVRATLFKEDIEVPSLSQTGILVPPKFVAWYQALLEYLTHASIDDGPGLTSRSIIHDLGIEYNRSNVMVVAEVLKEQGWIHQRKRVNGKRQYLWTPTERK